MTFAQRQIRLTTHFSERIPVVKRRTSVLITYPIEYITLGAINDESRKFKSSAFYTEMFKSQVYLVSLACQLRSSHDDVNSGTAVVL
jgi:hypothetical protein